MKKAIEKHIEKQHCVKVYLVDDNSDSIVNYSGFILEQNEDFILMNCDFDFIYDGFVILRKKDISEIRYTDHQRYQEKIYQKENRIGPIVARKLELGIRMEGYREFFEFALERDLVLTVECKYGSDDQFILGTINEVKKKKVRIDYISATGIYDFKPVTIRYEDITIISIDSEYPNLIRKYAVRLD